jgi:hypothetical protein
MKFIWRRKCRRLRYGRAGMPMVPFERAGGILGAAGGIPGACACQNRRYRAAHPELYALPDAEGVYRYVEQEEVLQHTHAKPGEDHRAGFEGRPRRGAAKRRSHSLAAAAGDPVPELLAAVPGNLPVRGCPGAAGRGEGDRLASIWAGGIGPRPLCSLRRGRRIGRRRRAPRAPITACRSSNSTSASTRRPARCGKPLTPFQLLADSARRPRAPPARACSATARRCYKGRITCTHCHPARPAARARTCCIERCHRVRPGPSACRVAAAAGWPATQRCCG